MTGAFFFAIGLEQLFERMAEAGAVTVLTPNRRLAAALLREFDERQIGRGLSAWEAADVLPLASFLERLYEDALYSPLAPALPVLLSAEQEQALWERAVERSEASAQLLCVPRAAALAREAWSVAHRWNLLARVKAFGASDGASEDCRAFLDWAARYERLTRRGSHTDRARLAELLGARLADPSLRKPAEIVVFGFDILAPRERDFLDALAGAGVRVQQCVRPACGGEAKRVAFGSAGEEIAAASAWARERLESAAAAGRSPRIGIVVPDLARKRASLVRSLSMVMQPRFGCGPGAAAPFNVSLGVPLASWPIVDAALALLALAAGAVPFALASRVLRSPFLAGAEAEFAARAKLDAELRRIAAAEISLDSLRALAGRERRSGAPGSARLACPVLQRSLAALSAASGGLAAERDARAWARAFSQLLEGCGYPGERTLDAQEYQALQKWHEAMHAFATLDRVAGRMSFGQARERLQRLAAETLFQPESPEVPVQVLGVLESAGLAFDHLWVTGLSEEQWPLAARPHPFLPIALQREAGVPEASAAASLELDRRITRGWLCAAPEVVFSHPLREDDRELCASPLIAEVPQCASDDLGLPAWESPAARLRRHGRGERIEERAPPLAGAQRPVPVAGGTAVFSDQAACPFRAFARHRLGARALEQPCAGLDARERGNLLHGTLARLWSRLKSHAHLRAAGSAGLEAIVAEAVEEELGRLRRARPGVLRERFARIERRRLARLALDWLAIERERPAFQVAAIEEKHALSFGGISVNAKLDRLDRVDTAAGPRHVVIDYKTGRVNVGSWAGPRPDDAQVPLYAVSRGGEIAAAAFALVRPGDMRFVGVARETGLIAGVDTLERQRQEALCRLRSWDSLLASWRRAFDALGSEFAAGEARVDPKEGERSCRLCELQALCRIGERGPAQPAEAG